MENKVHRIVLTGGPCGAKTTSLVAMAEYFEEAGFKVIVGFEGATALILNRMSPPKLGVAAFQGALFDFEIVKAQWLERTAAKIAAESKQPVLIIYDRTYLDAKAYTEPEHWDQLVAEYRPEDFLRPEDWGVVHLVTAAIGARDFYTTENNQARFESAEEAARRDGLIAEAYQHLEHRHVIDNRGTLAEKVHRAINAACRFVGIPEPLEIERGFEVESFEPEALAAHKPVRIEIMQFYLPDGSRYRRRRLPDGSMTYSRTWKREIGESGVRVEVSSPILAFDFGKALEENPSAPRIRKTRHVFDANGQRWELDVFEKPTGRIKLEAETPTRECALTVPHFIKVRREVTGDPRWNNAAMAVLP